MNVTAYPKAIVCEIHGPSDGYDTNEMINCNMNCRPTPFSYFVVDTSCTTYSNYFTFFTSLALSLYLSVPFTHSSKSQTFLRHIEWHVWKIEFKFII